METLKVYKSKKCKEVFSEQSLTNLINIISELDKQIVCNNCQISKKSFGLCPSEMETVCEYSNYNK